MDPNVECLDNWYVSEYSLHESDDLYEILHVHPSADPEVIKEAYRLVIKCYQGLDEEAHLINRAYAILSDPIKRTEYDRVRTSRNPLQRILTPGGVIYRNSSYDYSIYIPPGWIVVEENRETEKHDDIRGLLGAPAELRERWLKLESRRYGKDIPPKEFDYLPSGTVTICPEEMLHASYRGESAEYEAYVTITSAVVSWKSLDETVKGFIGDPLADFLFGLVLRGIFGDRFGFYAARHYSRRYGKTISSKITLFSGVKTAYFEIIPSYRHVVLLALVGSQLYLLQAFVENHSARRKQTEQLWSILDTFTTPMQPPWPSGIRRRFRKGRATRLVKAWLSRRETWESTWVEKDNCLSQYEDWDVEWTEEYLGHGVWLVTASHNRGYSYWLDWGVPWMVEVVLEGKPTRRYRWERRQEGLGGSPQPVENKLVTVSQWHVFEDNLVVNPVPLREYPEPFYDLVSQCH